MKHFLIFIMVAALVGCQGGDRATKEVSGLPKARPVEAREEQNAAPKVTRGEKESPAPSTFLTPANEARRAKWAAKRAKYIGLHQSQINQHQIRHENATGKTLPKVQIGENNPNPPRIDK